MCVDTHVSCSEKKAPLCSPFRFASLPGWCLFWLLPQTEDVVVEKHVDLFEHWFASKKGQGTQCSPHRHSTQTQVELSQVASIIHECNHPWNWTLVAGCHCQQLEMHIGSIKVSHLVAGSLPLLAAFASPFSSATSAPAFGLIFQKAHAPLGMAFCCNKKMQPWHSPGTTPFPLLPPAWWCLHGLVKGWVALKPSDFMQAMCW